MKIRQTKVFNPKKVRAMDHEIMEDLEILRGRPILMKRTRINRQPVKYFKDKKTKQAKIPTLETVAKHFRAFLDDLAATCSEGSDKELDIEPISFEPKKIETCKRAALHVTIAHFISSQVN